MKLILATAAMLACTGVAHAQRDAVSADLSPEIAGQVFSRAVAQICVPAVAGNGVSALSAAQQGTLRPTQDAETRKQAGASPDETVWDVMDGKGVVTVRERAGRCAVSVYGAPVKATIDGTAQALQAAPGAKGVSTVTVSAMKQATTMEVGPRAVVVEVVGSEPGTPGHRSKFSVVTGTVLRGQ